MGAVVKADGGARDEALMLLDELRKRGAVEVSVPCGTGVLTARFAGPLAAPATPRVVPKPMTKDEEEAAYERVLLGSAT